MLTVLAFLYVAFCAFWGAATYFGARKDNQSVPASLGSALFMALFCPVLLSVAVIGFVQIMRGKS
jgi:membrane-bound metal-dependent hydrolase YbcI (DUF457 family)